LLVEKWDITSQRKIEERNSTLHVKHATLQLFKLNEILFLFFNVKYKTLKTEKFKGKKQQNQNDSAKMTEVFKQKENMKKKQQKDKRKNGKNGIVKETGDEKSEMAPIVEQTTQNRQKLSNACILFLKSLPDDVKIKRSKQNINKKNNKAKQKFTFAHVEFKTEEIANKNYKELQHKKIRNQKIRIEKFENYVDFSGKKSSIVKPEKVKKEQPKEKDMKKLHISGFLNSTAESDLKKFFKNCTEFNLPIRKDTKLNFGFAFASFANEQEAKKALEASNGKELNGNRLVIDFAFKKQQPQKKQETEEPATKKLKNIKGEQLVKKKVPYNY
ncbi:nucleolin-like isoform X1, partial [Brachionus plicatilis]